MKPSVLMLALVAGGAAVAADQFPPAKREAILEAPVSEQAPPVRLIRGARVTLAPGQPTPRHRHPITVLGVVTMGTFTFQEEGGEAKTLHTGDAFFEPAGKVIEHFDNASTEQPAQIASFYLADSRDRSLTEILK